jgi:hypothetical protein
MNDVFAPTLAVESDVEEVYHFIHLETTGSDRPTVAACSRATILDCIKNSALAVQRSKTTPPKIIATIACHAESVSSAAKSQILSSFNVQSTDTRLELLNKCGTRRNSKRFKGSTFEGHEHHTREDTRQCLDLETGHNTPAHQEVVLVGYVKSMCVDSAYRSDIRVSAATLKYICDVVQEKFKRLLLREVGKVPTTNVTVVCSFAAAVTTSKRFIDLWDSFGIHSILEGLRQSTKQPAHTTTQAFYFNDVFPGTTEPAIFYHSVDRFQTTNDLLTAKL